MKKTLLITVSAAALVAAGGMAFAQGVNAPRDQPAAAAPAQNDKSNKMKVDTPRKTEAVKPTPSAQLPAKPNAVKSETSGQGSTVQPVQHDATTPKGQPDTPKGQAESPKAQVDTPKSQAESPKAQAETPKLPTQADAKQAAPAPLSAEHHAKIWESIRGEKSAPFSGAKFSITVGESVPQGIHLYRLPVRVIEFAPQYRGYEYVLVGDEILIVDPRTHRIVAVIAA
jgi:Ni/Co efflux regulator RcnB